MNFLSGESTKASEYGQIEPSVGIQMDRNGTTRVTPLLTQLKAPSAIAFSGGGDSTALLHACASNPLITHAFIIDHALRDGSAGEVQQAADFAHSLGYQVETQRWAHGGVTSGIQVKARHYRYAAMGRMCRAAGLTNLITGHTADDQAETLLMRLERGTGWRGLAGMREAGFAPLWPALMGLTLHRPWLGVSRAELRAYNADAGLKFIDDPSNESRDFTRVRARQALSADQDLRRDLLEQQKTALDRLIAERRAETEWLAHFAKISPHGFVETSAVPTPELLLHLLNAVSGRGGPIDAAKRRRLAKSMHESDFSGTTIAGAWVIKSSNGFVFTRDMVAVKGRKDVGPHKKLLNTNVETGHSRLWDGRFWVQAKTSDLTINPAYGQLGKIGDVVEFKPIFECPVEVRGCLPVYHSNQNLLGFGGLESHDVKADAVSAQRLHRLE